MPTFVVFVTSHCDSHSCSVLDDALHHDGLGLRMAPGMVVRDEDAVESQPGDNRISKVGAFGTSVDDNELDNLESGPTLIEAHLVHQEKEDIPHAVIHTFDDRDEREEERKRRRCRMISMMVLLLLVVGTVLAVLFLPPDGATSQAVPPGKLESDSKCNLSLECARSCCSNAYSTNDGISKCIPVQDIDSSVCINSDSPPMSPVNSSASTDRLPYVGTYWVTWGDHVNVQEDPNENFSVAFSGWNNITSALSESELIYSSLRGDKYIAFGGGNANGIWSEDVLLMLANATESGLLGSYDGILYSILIGDSGLVEHFLDSFALAKRKGLKVIVTFSTSAPRSFDDGAALVTAFLNDSNIDVISPILFESGTETSNLYGESNGVMWANYTNARPAIVPGLVRGGPYFTDAKNFFLKEYGVEIQGYIRWAQI